MNTVSKKSMLFAVTVGLVSLTACVGGGGSGGRGLTAGQESEGGQEQEDGAFHGIASFCRDVCPQCTIGWRRLPEKNYGFAFCLSGRAFSVTIDQMTKQEGRL